MCGIFGIVIGEDFRFSSKELMGIITHMFKLSESRGKEASGIAVKVNKSIYVFKEPISSSKMVKTRTYDSLLRTKVKQRAYSGKNFKPSIAVLGHSRLQTNGASGVNSNNQPIVESGAVCVHNGIIVNDYELWKLHPDLERKYDVDTEVFLSLLQKFRFLGEPLMNATKHVFRLIEGSASVAVLFDDINTMMLATNTGSLHICKSKSSKTMVFASEKYILQQAITSKNMQTLFDPDKIVQVKAGEGLLLDLETINTSPFTLDFDDAPVPFEKSLSSPLKIVELNESCILREDVKQSMLQTWLNLYSNENSPRRCSRCLLPETMPFIDFDDKGVCNYCRDYEHRGSFLKGEKALEEFVSKYRSVSGKPDCIVGFSGGRDSGYGLDYVKNHLHMNPIAFTYDWGMVNDLARRNQARICGKLGVEQIVVSADIKKKRENIRKNLNAWLKRPDLGMVPILMAGDKQFYYYFHKVRSQTGIKLFIFCGGYEGEEGTGLFKYGFCGVNEGKDKALRRLTGISIVNKLRIMFYYFKQFINNPAYINKSIIDTLFAYYSTYVLKDDYLYLYHYLDWDEKKILSNLAKFFWERETDTIATWRIDDGTASFYNYIYLTMAGFTEFDIFRSHQIREGKLTREEAYDLIKQENFPRFKSVEWYGQAINYDMNKVIEIINAAPKLYKNYAKQESVAVPSSVQFKTNSEITEPLVTVQEN